MLYNDNNNVLVLKPNIQNESFKSMFKILLFIKLFFELISLVSSVFSFIIIKRIKKESAETPLILINEGLTEDIYKNIIDQSQNPNDPKYKDTLIKLIRDSLYRSSDSKSNIDNSTN